MSSFGTASARTPREAPRVGGYQRGRRARTTRAGTWFPAVGPGGEPAGLLLVHPAVPLAGLRSTVTRLAALGLPGVLPVLPDLLEQAGRTWLVSTASPVPTLADLLDDGPHRSPDNAAALLSDVATTLLDAHDAGLAHGAVGASAVVLAPTGTGLLTDWGIDERASPRDDLAAWVELTGLLAERWCPDSVLEAAVLARAAYAAEQGGLEAALDHLAEPAASARRDELVVVTSPLAAGPPAPSPAHARPAGPPAWSPAHARPAGPPAPSSPRARPAGPAASPGEPHHPGQVGPAATGTPPPVKRPSRRWSRTWPVLLAVVLALVLAIAAVSVVEELRPPGRVQSPAPDGPLEIRTVTVEARLTATICAVVGTVTTNGRPGRVVYRWVGEAGSQPVTTVSTSASSSSVEVGLLWSPNGSPLPGSSVTLQVLEPRPSTTTASVPPSCT